MSYLSDNAYLAVKPESVGGTAVIPTNFIPLVSENIRTVVNHSADRRMKGLDWKANDLLRGNRNHEGEIVALADPDSLGHFLNMFLLKGSTTGNATDGYTHPFTVGASDFYSIEIKKGLYCARYFGVKIDELRLEFADGQAQIKASIKAMGQFSVARLGVALTGAGMTSIVLDDEYDLNPTRGLVIGDVITIGSNDVTLTGVSADGITVTFGALSLTYSVGEPIYLKPQTVTLPTLQDPLYFGNMLVGVGADIATAVSNAGAIATATPIYDLAIVLKNNLFAGNGTGRFDPVQILTRTKEGAITMKQLLENENQTEKFLNRGKQAICIIAKGKFIKSDFTTQEKLTLKFNNVKLMDNENALEVGEYIVDSQTFEVLYDNSDAQAMDASLINRTAGTAY